MMIEKINLKRCFFGLVLLLFNFPTQSTALDSQVLTDIGLTAFGSNQFNTDLDHGGEVDVQRYSIKLSAQRQINSKTRLGLGFNYHYEDWDFTGQTFLGTQPWERIQRFGVHGYFRYRSQQNWSFHFIPIIQSSGESDAEFDDALVFGGTVLAAHRFSPKFTLGAGGSVYSEIEVVTVKPYLVLNWQITDSLCLANPNPSRAISPAGLELTYQPSGWKWEFALGGAKQFYRFRLDDTAPAANGIGQVEGFPIWLRSTYKITPSILIDVFAGYVYAGNLRLEDQDGDLINEDDYDPALIGAITIHGRF